MRFRVAIVIKVETSRSFDGFSVSGAGDIVD